MLMGPCQTLTGDAEIKQFSYFTEHFKDESYHIEFLTIDDTQLTASTHVQSRDRFHIPLLLLDRLVQSIGFVAIQHVRQQQNRPLRFIFIRQMNWCFSGPVRPSLPVLVQASYRFHDETIRKQCFDVKGAVNRSASFSLSVDVISTKGKPGCL
ncbi:MULTISPECIES: hypothetical protein [Ochrobactrum]|uniref:Uncharacterized protein n=1 Tax=Ochrobactrum quorumnocens TaxID=271865 RepID=A0A5N1JYE0_9HYPH|nr:MULTISPECIES: hypothetical protein [Brucella/Ochrobactrum group]KAA9368249.1 hypothetical protein F3W84_10180 [[Ochrobactrum] quorumnocens]MBD7991852.1 hypothetical protein [Ochrobactrum gallinarum]MDH7792443.1 hypothetical protein [Ochrobactrum sp. AN78]